MGGDSSPAVPYADSSDGKSTTVRSSEGVVDAPDDSPPAPKRFTYYIIKGQITEGGKFRPSDWCDRLHSTLRALGDDAEMFSEYVHLISYDNQRCLMLDTELEEINFSLYSFFIRFAADNHLVTHTITREDWASLHSR